jgi:hypothetical protein
VPITSYDELQDAVASLRHRTGDTTYTSEVPTFIALCESEMQIRLKLMEFETDASVTVTDGSGDLPAGFLGFRTLYWNGDTKSPLYYKSPAEFDALRNNTGNTPAFYTISGSTLRLTEGATGTAIGVANVRFTTLSDSDTSNAILTNFPDAYLYGSAKHSAVWEEDDPAVQKYGILFNAACDRIEANNKDRKHAGPLQVRAR